MGILQERILEWVTMPSWPRDQTPVSCTAGRFFTSWATKEVHNPPLHIYIFSQIAPALAIENSFRLTPVYFWHVPSIFFFLTHLYFLALQDDSGSSYRLLPQAYNQWFLWEALILSVGEEYRNKDLDTDLCLFHWSAIFFQVLSAGRARKFMHVSQPMFIHTPMITSISVHLYNKPNMNSG